MKFVTKRIITLITILTVVILSVVPVYAQMTDVNGHWAAEQIGKWADKGIIKGNPDGTFAPDRSITRAEFSSIICRIFGYIDMSKNTFADVQANAWYYNDVSKASAAGIIKGDGTKFRPNDPITRQEAAVIISRAFKTEPKYADAANKYSDKNSIASWAFDAVNALTSNGYLSGRAGGSFAPTAGITRAETIKLIDNILSDIKNEKGTYTGDAEKSLLINADGVTLKDMVIKGDLILAQGIGEGDVTLDNVKVEGRTIVLGGGENSIHLVNTSVTKLLIIKSDGKVRIVAQGTTDIQSVAVQSGAKLEEKDLKGTGFNKVEVIALEPGHEITLDGDFDEVVVDASNAEVKVLDGTVGKLSVSEKAAGTKIDIAETAKVATLDAGAKLSVTGKGTIENANINADGVVIEKEPTKTNVASGVTANVGGKEVKGNEGSTAGGNGGSYTPSTPGITFEMSLTKVGGGSIPATRSGDTYTFDLTGVANDVVINGMKITGSSTITGLKFTNVDETVTVSDGVIGLSGNNSLVEAYFGIGFDFDGDVSVQTIKSIFSGTITREVAIMNGANEIKKVTISIKISNSGDVLGDEDLLDCFTLRSTTPGAITATIKTGKETTPVLSGSGFYTTLKNMITVPSGYSFDGVAIGSGAATYTKNSTEILINLAGAADVGVNEMTLNDLKGVTVTLKASSPNNADRLVTITFE